MSLIFICHCHFLQNQQVLHKVHHLLLHMMTTFTIIGYAIEITIAKLRYC